MEYLCEGVTLLGGALSFAGRVAERKDDGSLVEGGHVPDDLLRERPSNSCHACIRTTVRLTVRCTTALTELTGRHRIKVVFRS